MLLEEPISLEVLLKKIYLIPNAITAFGLSCGLFVIFKVSITNMGSDLFDTLQSLAILVLFAAIADLADGAIARWMKAESEFGGQFDSLADAVTFGVAPPLLALKSLSDTQNLKEGAIPLLTFFMVVAAMVYTLCGVLRLVRYNVHAKQAKEEALKGDVTLLQSHKKHFTGLPIPAAAAAAVSATLFSVCPFINPISLEVRCGALAIVFTTLGFFMVSRWKFPSLKALHFRVPSFNFVFATGIIAVMVLYGILDYFAIVFFALSWLYLIIAWTLSIARLIVYRRSQTLQDFEPEAENEEEIEST